MSPGSWPVKVISPNVCCAAVAMSPSSSSRISEPATSVSKIDPAEILIAWSSVSLIVSSALTRSLAPSSAPSTMSVVSTRTIVSPVVSTLTTPWKSLLLLFSVTSPSEVSDVSPVTTRLPPPASAIELLEVTVSSSKLDVPAAIVTFPVPAARMTVPRVTSSSAMLSVPVLTDNVPTFSRPRSSLSRS